LPRTSHRPNASAAISRSVQMPRGRWPSDPTELPYFLNKHQLAHLLDKSVRTLERRRQDGTSLPYVTFGRQVLYPRDAVLKHLMKSATNAA
jgi:hypothetical protein